WVESLREQGVEAEVILLAERGDVGTAIAAVRARVSDLLLRPLNLAQIEASVARCFAQRLAVKAANEPAQPVLRDRPQELVEARCEMLKSICTAIKRVAPTPATVLVLGESGTGKEVAARSLHAFSGRKGSFVPINCGAMSPELLESELFGHAKGAFTGAHQARDGLFTYADAGTLFLDEIADMPMGMQSKLLRVLDDQKIRPVGGNREVPVDVRVIAATNRDLSDAVRAGDFREDLYYRINVLTIRMPALRERREDIPVLAEYFVGMFADELSMPRVPVTEDDIRALSAQHWPGNVREFRNVIERSVLLGQSPADSLRELAVETRLEGDVTARPGRGSDLPLTLADVEKQHILSVLDGCRGNKSEAARKLGVSRKTLDRKLQLWGHSAH
ncbi:MAG: sigma-54-dependent Fis family transcriptional regulator, partial [Thioalkalivibrio sp.]